QSCQLLPTNPNARSIHSSYHNEGNYRNLHMHEARPQLKGNALELDPSRHLPGVGASRHPRLPHERRSSSQYRRNTRSRASSTSCRTPAITLCCTRSAAKSASGGCYPVEVCALRLPIPSIRHDLTGFQALAQLNAQAGDVFFEDIDITMADVRWFDADMSAPFGAILHRLGDNLNTVRLLDMHRQVETILSKNSFLATFGRDKLPDTWGTTVHYQRFDPQDGRYFAQYVQDKLVARSEIPRMSPGLLKRFRESVFEIFSNSVIHSQTKLGIFRCGQYYPEGNRLNFAVADLGIGIRNNIKLNLGIDLAPEQAIDWAAAARNTTKRGRIPGGLGLKLLRKFISLNGGRIQIVSDAGYWCQDNDTVSARHLRYPFPGTVVNIEINTSDTQSYVLSSETSPADIF
ncbi:MAG: ATP-binding protein, partial [Chloroflexota bacterium]